jgi:hypothetical protein
VDISHATSCGVTQVLVASRGLVRSKWLLLGNLVGEELVLKFEKWRDSSISRVTRLGATKMATSWKFSWGGVSFKILD